MNDDERYRRAKARIEQLVGFYSHAGAYVLVNGMLFIINMLTSPSDLWFFWPLLGWGIGLASHALGVFVAEGPSSKNWQERKIRALMDEDRAVRPIPAASGRDQDQPKEQYWPDLSS